MENQNQPPATVSAFMLLGGMMNSQVVAALIKTDIIESLESGPLSTDKLALMCHVNQNVLSRTLRFAAFIGLVNFDEGKYSLTDVGRCFLKNVPGSLYGSASFISAHLWRDSWNNFTNCLVTGLPAFDNVMGMPFFEFLNTNEECGTPFNNYQTMMTTMVAPIVPEAYNFNLFKTICDVGGGQGILLKSILERAPKTEGILFTLSSLFYDLHMQVMLGGSERTEEEFSVLFLSAGLKLNSIISTRSPMKIIEASI